MNEIVLAHRKLFFAWRDLRKVFQTDAFIYPQFTQNVSVLVGLLMRPSYLLEDDVAKINRNRKTRLDKMNAVYTFKALDDEFYKFEKNNKLQEGIKYVRIREE